MKKIFLLLLLCPIVALAEFYHGTITFNDGSTKTGLIELPSSYNKAKLKFKTDKTADVEKFKTDDIKEFTATGEDNNYQTTYLALKHGYYVGKKYKVTTEKNWFRIEKKGKINILTAYSPDTGYHYYIHKSWEDRCCHIASFYGGLTITIGEFKALKKYVELFFKEDCPQLAESITKEDYKKRSLNIINDNYLQLCDK